MDKPDDLNARIDALERALLSLDRINVEEAIRQSTPGQPPMETIEQVVVPTLERIGQGWETGRISLAQVYMSGRMIETIVDTILPPKHPDRTDQPPMAIAVLEDYHMLGMRIIYSALRASGYELFNYQHMDIDTLVNQVKTDGIKILLISVLMLPSALHIKDLRAALEKEGCAVKLLVGGAPFRFDRQLWQEVGADAVGYDATEAISAVKKLIEEVE